MMKREGSREANTKRVIVGMGAVININCTACVQVCPMGIDIRDGLQMDIACGLCVDACDEIMDKIDLPRGLIRYDTEHNMDISAILDKRTRRNRAVRVAEAAVKMRKDQGRIAAFMHSLRLIRPRTIYYTCVISIVGFVMLYTLATRSPLSLQLCMTVILCS